MACARSIAADSRPNDRSSITALVKLPKSSTDPIVSASVSAISPSFSAGHSDAGTYDAGGRRALLPGVLERAADQRGPQHVDVGRGVGDDEVLAAGLADQPRVGPVAGDVRARPPTTVAGTPGWSR